MRTNEAPVPKNYWKSEVGEAKMPQVQDLLENVSERKKVGVTGATVMLSWLQRRIQPLQQRTNFEYQYTGAIEPLRITLEGLDDRLALKMLKRALLGIHTLPAILELFCVEKPLTPMSS